MSNTHLPTNYLGQIANAVRTPDFRSRLVLTGLVVAAVMLPIVDITIEGLDERRLFYVGHLLRISGWSWLLVAGCIVSTVLPALPAASLLVRPIDILLGAASPLLAYAAYIGFQGFRATFGRMDSIGMLDPSFAPSVSWNWGLPFAVAAVVFAMYRGIVAAIRPLHV